jgi:hypothetical protein
MGLIQIPVADIADLGTQVAMHGTVSIGQVGVDDVFELIVGVIAVVIEIIG